MPWWSRPPTGSNPSEQRPSSRADQEDFLDRWFESVMRQNEDAFHRGMFGGNFGHNHPHDNDRHQHASFSASYSSSYQMHEDDKLIQIAVDVPGMSRDDLDVKVTSQAGPYSPCVVELGPATSGEKGTGVNGEGKTDESTMNNTQDAHRGPPRRLLGQRFRLGKNVDCDHLAANLSKGVLLLTAPKFQPEPEPESATRSIPITERDD